MTGYFHKVIERLSRTAETQAESINKAGDAVGEALAKGGLWFLFGTGHSHMLALEAFYRAGGLVGAVPILPGTLMLHESATASSQYERVPGLAEKVFDSYGLGEQDVLLIASNSGRNAVPVEMAEIAQEKGVRTIGVTSLEHSGGVTSRAPSGRRLFEVVDIVIDNGAPLGDALTPAGADENMMGPVSTITGAAIVNAIAIEAAKQLRHLNVPVYTWQSANIDPATGPDDHAYLQYVEKVRQRTRHL